MNWIENFWQSERKNYLLGLIIYSFIFLLLAAKNKAFGNNLIWAIFFIGAIIILILGFIVWIGLGGHKDD